jgi:uncharacterized BrkB/YihY/UPF0761 family membrane protein
MSKKIFKPLIFLFLFVFPLLVSAVSIDNPLKANSFYELLNSIIDLLYYLAIPTTALMLIIAGFFFIFAQGEPGKIETAKTILKWALLGFLIILLAKGMVQLMQNIFMNQSGGF